MTTHAVAQSTTSGAVPLLRRDTTPSEPEQTHLPGPTAPLFRRQGEAAIEDTVPRPPRVGDATQLSIPILIVIAMLVSGVTAAISASGVYWMLRLSNQEAQNQMQADIRSIREGLASRERENAEGRRADAAELKLQIQSFENTKQSVDAMRGIVQLLQLQMAELLKQRRP